MFFSDGILIFMQVWVACVVIQQKRWMKSTCHRSKVLENQFCWFLMVFESRYDPFRCTWIILGHFGGYMIGASQPHLHPGDHHLQPGNCTVQWGQHGLFDDIQTFGLGIFSIFGEWNDPKIQRQLTSGFPYGLVMFATWISMAVQGPSHLPMISPWSSGAASLP